MIKQLHFKTLLLLCAMIMGIGSAWAEEATLASFDAASYNNGDESQSSWTVTKAEYAAAGGGYYKLLSSDASIVTPSIDWTKSSNITITISARKYGGPDATQGRISVSQGDKELASYSPSGTSIVASSELSISPVDGPITISCPGASSGKGCGIQSIVIKESTGGETPMQTVATPQFSPASGTYTSVQNVSISTATNGATIYYTTDNNTPTTNSSKYSSAIEVSTTTTIKAIAVKEGMNNSSVAEATYTINIPYTGAGYVRINDLSDLTDGAKVIIAARYNATATSYYAMTAATTGKPTGVSFTSVNGNNGESLPQSILDDINSYSWTVSVTTDGYTFTNAKNETLGYTSGTSFATGGDNKVWAITAATSGNSAMVSGYDGFYITNTTKKDRGIALNDSHNYGPYSVTNINSSSYNFYLDLFVEGATPTLKPSISANDVDINYDATSGNIAYTINNPVNGGQLTAAVATTTTVSWLTLGTVGTTIPFTCGANNTNAERTATVTLTYTYGSESVTKDVTITQAANPNAVDNISDITAAGDYTVKGTIVAKSQRGFIVGDGTGYVYYYNQNYTQTDYNIGDKVKLSGAVKVYGGVYEFDNSTTITAATESNYQAENPTVLSGSDMDTRVASTTPAQLSNYVQYQGTLTVNGTRYNITNIEGAKTAIGSISYPISTDFTSLNGKTVKVSGYFVGISSSTYYNTIIGSVEEVASTAPVINVEATVNLAANATSGEFGYSITNPVTGTGLTAACQADWISNITVGNDKVTFEASANEGAAREATITLTYINVTKSVTVKQAAPVQPASLPFAFDGGIADVKQENGMTQEGLGTDYNSSPKLKFDGTGDYLILSFNDRPGKLTFDIKGNGFSGGTFTVQTSEDGVTYTDLETYTELGATQTEEFNNLGENVRYIKWIYTEKVDGNVALGNINLAKYKELQKYTLTVSGLENVSLFVFDAAAQNDPLIPNGGNGSAQVLEGTQVLISPAPAEGYELQSLLVDGVDHKADLEPGGSYTFTMPEKNITITATVSEVIPVETTTYTLATTITSGKHYIITNGVDKAMGGQNNNNRAAVDATIHEGKASVASDAGVCEVVIYGPYTVGENQCYTIYDEAKGYLYAASSSSNHLKTEELLDADGNGQWTIEIDNEGIATIKAQGKNSRNWMRFNGSGNGLFACYASNSNQSEIYLFEKDGDNGTGTTTVQIAEACTDGEKYYGTYSNENAFVVPSDVTVAEIGIKDGALNVKEYVTGSLVPANTGVMISSATPGDKSLTLAIGGASLMGEGNALRPSGPNGITAERMAETGDYLYYRLTMHKGTQIGFWWGAAGGAAFDLLAANKAYLVVPVMNEAREGFAFGDETTGIGHMLMSGEQTTRIYDLQGRSVAQPTKGLYIVNGKKVVVK